MELHNGYIGATWRRAPHSAGKMNNGRNRAWHKAARAHAKAGDEAWVVYLASERRAEDWVTFMASMKVAGELFVAVTR